MNDRHYRRVRSFVRRPGRITVAQRRALDRLWPRWGIAYTQRPVDLDAAFGRRAPRVLDIGFGDGEALLTCAASHPDVDYLGVEVHEPGIGHLLVLLEQAGVDNVRIIARDVVDVARDMLADRSFRAVNLFFPDPWPKKRHHKRRLLQPDFAAEVARLLVDGGLFHFATDSASYAEHAQACMAEAPDFARLAEPEAAADPLASRPPTKFESRGRRLGHEVTDLYFRRRPRG